jgi:tetratricopeptide (TPR) repeat protein
LVILLGPAGIGKTRIAEWLFATIHEQGRMLPLWARYRPIRSTMDGMLGAVTQYYNFERADRETIERSLMLRWKVREHDEKMRAWVAGTAEWLRPLAPGNEYKVGPSGVRFSLDTPEVLREVTRFTLRKIANGRPLFFFLDDLHNAADATLDGLLRIHDTETDQPILMVATVRSEEVQKSSAIAEHLRNLRERLDGQVVEVSPLDREMTCELVRAALPLDDDAVNEAARRSHGFPLFALQQLHAWAHAGDLEYASGTYRVPKHVLAVRPKTTAELWDSRIAALPQRYREAAYAVAPLGIDVRRSVLHALLAALGFPIDETIVSLQQAEVLLPRGPDRYSWPHALLQEHLFRRLSERADAQAFFSAAATALATHPLANTRRVVRQIVVNLLYAGNADAASSTFFDFLEKGWNGSRQPASTLADLELLRGHLTGRSLALEHRWRAEALRHLGRIEESGQDAEAALELFDKLGDQANVAHSLRLLGQIASFRGDSKEGLRRVTRAHEIFQREKVVLGMAQCEAALGEIEYLQGNYERARGMAERAEEHYAEIDERLGQGQCLLLLSRIAHSEGAAAKARALTAQARGAFELTGYRLGIAQTTATIAHIEHRLMNFHNARSGGVDALGIFESLRTLEGQASCQRLLAMVAVDVDDVETAENYARSAHALYEEMASPWGLAEAHLLLAQLALCRRDLKQAELSIQKASEVKFAEPEPKQHFLLTRAWLELERGDSETALATLAEAQAIFPDSAQVGDHTPHLLARLSRRIWKDPKAVDWIRKWRERIGRAVGDQK